MATYAIGDVQGCFEPLQALLGQIGFSAARDRLVFVGDLVNRGPASLEVLRFVKSLGERALTVLGNHDLHLAMVAEGYGKKHKEDTLEPILAATDRDELLAWLRSQPLVDVEDDYVFVHAGLLPQWSVAKARALSDEASHALTVPDYRSFLAHMFGSEPAYWLDDLQGWDRLRVIVNAMTRMRFCTPEGRMEFKHKGAPERAPAGFLPWFEVPGRASATHTVVFGHWSAMGFRQAPKMLALDSGCLWGGAMTAVRLEDRKVYQVTCAAAADPDPS
jgi:bis(5'-nucleosyl)-tetraphosphatase (symmetrical)